MGDIIPDDLWKQAERNLQRGCATEPAPPDRIHRKWVHMAVLVSRTCRQLHLIPVRDIKPHQLCEGCKCGAFEDPESADHIIHNAFDGREDYERGLRMKH